MSVTYERVFLGSGLQHNSLGDPSAVGVVLERLTVREGWHLAFGSAAQVFSKHLHFAWPQARFQGDPPVPLTNSYSVEKQTYSFSQYIFLKLLQCS